MNDVIPCFISHYSLPDGILTFEAKGKTKAGAPASIVDLCIENDIKDCMVVDSTLGGAYEASRNLAAANVNLFFGYKVIVCADENDKSEKSMESESKVIIFPKNDSGWNQLIKIANRASTDGFYYKARTSWKQLKEFWTPDLELSLPFFSSFIAKNTLTLNHIIPDLPAPPTLLREMESGLPFAPIIDKALMKYGEENKYSIDKIKTIYYNKSADFEKYITYRAKTNRTTFAKPNIDHLASDKFSVENWKNL